MPGFEASNESVDAFAVGEATGVGFGLGLGDVLAAGEVLATGEVVGAGDADAEGGVPVYSANVTGPMVTGVSTEANDTVSLVAVTDGPNGATTVPPAYSAIEYVVPEVIFEEVYVSDGDADKTTLTLLVNVRYKCSSYTFDVSRRLRSGVMVLGAVVLSVSLTLAAMAAIGKVPVTV